MLEERIYNDYKEAMKAKDALRSSVLSFLRADMLNLATAKKKEKLQDSEVIAVIRKQIKQRQDSIEQFKKGNRMDMAEKEEKELKILKSYLPDQLSEDEIRKIVEETLVSLGAKDMKDMGRVMKELMDNIAGRADAKFVSELVRQRLRG